MHASSSDEGQHDHELVRAVAAGDAVALGTLYDRYSGVLMALGLRILRNRSDAEELVGDMLWELWNRPERYDPKRGNLLAYLITLTRSRAIDRLRSRRRGDAVVLPVDNGAVEESAREDNSASPLASALLGERRRRIQGALSKLKPDQRQAIELSFYDGLSHSEISDELKQPLGTIKSRIRSGLIRLKDSLRIAYGSEETS